MNARFYRGSVYGVSVHRQGYGSAHHRFTVARRRIVEHARSARASAREQPVGCGGAFSVEAMAAPLCARSAVVVLPVRGRVRTPGPSTLLRTALSVSKGGKSLASRRCR